jgi:hypothetical protein
MDVSLYISQQPVTMETGILYHTCSKKSFNNGITEQFDEPIEMMMSCS